MNVFVTPATRDNLKKFGLLEYRNWDEWRSRGPDEIERPKFMEMTHEDTFDPVTGRHVPGPFLLGGHPTYLSIHSDQSVEYVADDYVEEGPSAEFDGREVLTQIV